MTRTQTAPIRGPRILGDEELFDLAARAVSYSLDITRDEIEAMAAALLDREHDRAALQAERDAHHACALELDAAHTEVSRLRALLLDHSMRSATIDDDDTVVIDVDCAPTRDEPMSDNTGREIAIAARRLKAAHYMHGLISSEGTEALRLLYAAIAKDKDDDRNRGQSRGQ